VVGGGADGLAGGAHSAGHGPKTSSGKLQRRKTRQQFEDGTLGQEAPTTDSLGAKVAVGKQVARSYVNLARSEVMSRLPDPIRNIFGQGQEVVRRARRTTTPRRCLASGRRAFGD
jgi:hypothetical protein